MSKILIINGSPKGDLSVTLHYMIYAKQELNFEYDILNLANSKNFELDVVKNKLNDAELIFFIAPLYYCFVPSQFIEVLNRLHEVQDLLKNKKATFISTSINFFDFTAHDYMKQIITESFNMNYIESYSLNMSDIEDKKARKNFLNHINFVLNFDKICSEKAKKASESIAIIFDNDSKKPSSHNFTNHFSNIENFNIDEANIASGCLGCCKCGFDNICEIKDGYKEFFEKIQKFDVITMLMTEKNFMLTPSGKKFFDRSFYKNHTPTFKDKHLVILYDGDLKNNNHMKTFLENYPKMQDMKSFYIIETQNKTDEIINKEINKAFNILKHKIEKNMFIPSNFYYLAGRKIFRDAVYENLNVIFHKDHEFYKKNNYYDFPNRKYLKSIFNFVIRNLLKVKFLQKKFKKFMIKGMIMNFKKYIR